MNEKQQFPEWLAVYLQDFLKLKQKKKFPSNFFDSWLFPFIFIPGIGDLSMYKAKKIFEFIKLYLIDSKTLKASKGKKQKGREGRNEKEREMWRK